jgi:hypothetical protein
MDAKSCVPTIVPRPGSAPGKAGWSAENGPEDRQNVWLKRIPAVVCVPNGRVVVGQLAAFHRDECVDN